MEVLGVLVDLVLLVVEACEFTRWTAAFKDRRPR